ncbi:MAG: pilus assembly protein TadG-related protein [Hyphomonadaceae bacterium]
MMAAGAAPLLLGCAGLAVDFASAWSARSNLQAAADGAAIAAATELPLRSTSAATVQSIAERYVRENAGRNVTLTSIASNVLDNRAGVRVTVAGHTGSIMGSLFNADGYSPQVEAVARLAGGVPLCALTLEERQGRGIYLERRGRIRAPNCAVVSNSTSPRGIVARDNTELEASMICSAGGYEGSRGNFSPLPVTDCPAVPDPLANREEPDAGGCTHLVTLSVTGTRNLRPGVYCGGLTILPGATARLAPGVYVMKNGPLLVMNGGALEGDGVGFYFVGDLSTMRLSARSRINLSAPRSGPMAGFLFFANRVLLTANLNLRRFRIESNDARTLLGTIYLRDGVLEVASNRPIADRSAYTVVVARRIEVSAGPDLVLNTDYDGTDVPVPDGVGPRPPQAYLSE